MAIQALRNAQAPHQLLRQHQAPIVGHLAPRGDLQMQQRMAHHTTPGLRPRQLPGLHSGPRIDVTGALECDRYFHLEALSFGYLLLLGRSTYTLLQRAFLFLPLVAISLCAYFRPSVAVQMARSSARPAVLNSESLGIAG